MKYKKVHANIFKLTGSLIFLFLFGYFMIFADKFQVEIKKNEVSAEYLGLKDSSQDAGYVSIDSLLFDDVQPDKFMYIVRNGDNLSQIAQNFGTTVSNIKKVNNLTSDRLTVGSKLVISQVDGILYEMPSGMLLSDFAKKYTLNISDIKDLNNFQDDSYQLLQGDELFLPLTLEQAKKNGLITEKEEYEDLSKPAKNIVKSTPSVLKKVDKSKVNTIVTYMSNKDNKKVEKPVSNNDDDNDTPSKGSKILKTYTYKSPISNGFAAGFCTRWAATQRPDIFKYVSTTRQDRPFGGDAKYWYDNAKKAGFAVGKEPRVGAIGVFYRGNGGYSSYGHVGIVRKVDKENGIITFEDMNYKGRYIVTLREMPINPAGLVGYIY